MAAGCLSTLLSTRTLRRWLGENKKEGGRTARKKKIHETFTHRTVLTRRSVHTSFEISREMGQLTINTDETLKVLAMYYLTAPTLLWCYTRLGDANGAACHVSRKGSGCTHLMLVRYQVFAGTTTQLVISLLSRESTFHAAVRGACRTLDLAELMMDVGFSMQAELCTDGNRRGGGQVRIALLCGYDKQSHDGKFESRAGSTLSADVEWTKMVCG